MLTRIALTILILTLATGGAHAQQPTGWAARRPVLASACPHGCPWGELGEFVAEAMAPMGYDVVLCRNCNRDRGPRLVATASVPPPLDGLDAYVGTTTRVDAPVDFGITASGMLASAYDGRGGYAKDGPRANLRLIARIEDPMYLMVAVRKDTGITDLAEIAAKKLPVKILAGSLAEPVLAHYGITREAVTAWGGAFGRAMGADKTAPFDLIIDDLASPAMNPESSQWTTLSQAHDLRFLQLPEALLDELAREPGYGRVTARWGLLRGVDRPIRTVGRSGEVVFARADTPEAAAYDIAKAVDAHRAELKWLIRPYSYDPRTVWRNEGVPLHPGAARYYREAGYMR